MARIDAALKHFESTGVRVRRLNTTRAFHSVLVEPALGELEACFAGIEVKPPSIAVVSNVTGHAIAPNDAMDGSYWRRHARDPVAFARGVKTLAELGVDTVVEIGPRPVLAGLLASAWPDSAEIAEPMALASLYPPTGNSAEREGGVDLARAVADAYEAGLPVRFAGLFAGEARRRISLPGYPFQRERYWLEPAKRRRAAAGHPILGVRHESASGAVTFETEVFPSDPEWLSDHQVFGRVIAPGALYGAMAAATSFAEGADSVVVEDLQLHNALVFPRSDSQNGGEGAGRTVHVVLGSSEGADSRPVQIFSRGSDGGWTVHVEGRVSPQAPVPDVAASIELESLKESLSPVDVSAYYRAQG